MNFVRLKAGREKSVLRKHPWVFSGAVAEVSGFPEDGETVPIVSSKGDFLAWGAFNSQSKIRIRIWSWDRDEQIDRDFFDRRIRKALSLRSRLESGRRASAVRLVYGESDGLPGLIVDQYADVLVVQLLSCGVEHWRPTLLEVLEGSCPVNAIYERSDVDVRRLEGLPERVGLSRGEEPPEKIQVFENSLQFWVDVRRGHKTGFYLDQRENRLRLRELVPGKDVLDCFCYTGGFTLSALAGGAKAVTAIDSSADALQMAKLNLELNNYSVEQVDFIQGDVFNIMREFRDRGLTFDTIVLDPPKFAPTPASAARAARGYKDINLLAFKLLRPGGCLVTFSCSGGVDAALFQSIVAGAALDAGLEGRIVDRLFQSPDHPVALNYPEGAYLKGLVIKI